MKLWASRVSPPRLTLPPSPPPTRLPELAVILPPGAWGPFLVNSAPRTASPSPPTGHRMNDTRETRNYASCWLRGSFTCDRWGAPEASQAGDPAGGTCGELSIMGSEAAFPSLTQEPDPGRAGLLCFPAGGRAPRLPVLTNHSKLGGRVQKGEEGASLKSPLRTSHF